MKLDRQSLELQWRNITVEHIPDTINKAADYLSRLPFVTRKRNDSPLNNINYSKEPTIEVTYASIPFDCIKPEKTDATCRLSKIDLTDMISQKETDKQYIIIENTMKNRDRKFPDRDRYAIDQENGQEYKAVVVPKALVPTVLKDMHDRFGHFGICKTYSLIERHYLWPKMIKDIQSHIDSCSFWLQLSINNKLLRFFFDLHKSLS